MQLTRLSIRRPVFVIVLMATFIILGLFSRSKMQVEERPRVDIPRVTIQATYRGTGPEEMETLVTKPLEDAVSSVDGIRNITSSSQYGVSFVQLEFFIGTNSYTAAQEVRQKVDGIARLLPRDMDPPSVSRFDINALPIIYAGIRGDADIKQLRFLIDTNIKYRLAQIPGVGQVNVTGGDVREIRVSVDKRRLEAWNLSINDVVTAIQRGNVDFPSGHITEGARDYDARLIGLFQSPEQMQNMDLAVRNGTQTTHLKLRDVAKVVDTTAERTSITRIWLRERPQDKLEGHDTVGITVTKLADANELETVEGVKAEMKRLERDMPGHIRFEITQDNSVTVHDALDDINVSLVLGALLAVFVVFLFLHNLRGTMICAIAIPMSLIATFIPMYFLGQSLNSMTLLGLSLVVGILVDDSIVVLENIYRHLHRGETPHEAALNGRGEIGLAAIIITMVDVVVFLPMIWMGGIIGMFFRAFGITVAMATLFSLLVSFTVTPWLASRWYRMGEDLDVKTGGFYYLEKLLVQCDHAYRHVLGWILNTPRWFPIAICGLLTAWLGCTLIASTGAFVNLGNALHQPWIGSNIPAAKDGFLWFGIVAGCMAVVIVFMIVGWWKTAGRMAIFSVGMLLFCYTMQVQFPLMKVGYIPAGDQSQLGVMIELPAGKSMYETDRITRQVETLISGIPEVRSVFTVVGVIQGGGRDAPQTGPQYSQMSVQLFRKPDVLEQLNPFLSREERALDFRKRADGEIAAEIRKKAAGIPGVQFVAVPFRGFGGVSAPVQVELLGFDLVKMRKVANQVRAMMAKIPGVLSSDISLRPGKPEAEVIVDRVKASQIGLEVGDIGRSVHNAYQGDDLSKFQDPNLGEQFDIRVQFADLDRGKVEDVAQMIVGHVRTPEGTKIVRMNEVATVRMGEGPNKIDRKNRLRKATVSAYVLPGVVPMKINEVVEQGLKKIPLGDIQVSAGGDADRARTEYPFLFTSLALSFVLVYLLMAVLFDNLLHPLTIQLSLPMALIGAVVVLVWADQMLTVISMVGFIMLMGIVQKNAILLVDYINTLRARGYERDTAIQEAGTTRLRPILMTTLAMVSGMAPVALKIGRQSELRAPLAFCVIGGLVVSTILSLVVIPCIYSVFDDLQTWIGGLLRRGRRNTLIDYALSEEPSGAE